jgi:hypothetical protein
MRKLLIRWFQPSWLAMIAASDGTIVWEQHIGNGKGMAVVRAAEDAFLVANFEATGTDRVYEEGVAVQKVTADGKVGPSTIVRPGINTQKGASYGSLSIFPNQRWSLRRFKLGGSFRAEPGSV